MERHQVPEGEARTGAPAPVWAMPSGGPGELETRHLEGVFLALDHQRVALTPGYVRPLGNRFEHCRVADDVGGADGPDDPDTLCTRATGGGGWGLRCPIRVPCPVGCPVAWVLGRC